MDASVSFKMSWEALKAAISIYRTVIVKWPLSSILTTSALAVLYPILIITMKSHTLDIVIGATETYVVNGSSFALQRIITTTENLLIDDVTIRVELPMAADLATLNTIPHVSYSMNEYTSGDDRKILEFTCSSFDENQRLELIFSITGTEAREPLILVKVTGKGKRGEPFEDEERGMFWKL